MKILVIDNYDSFTYNLVHFLGELGAQSQVRRNDKITLEEISAMAPEAIVLSPGPCTPNEAGICLDLVKRFDGQLPIFGVCLGLQSIAQALGGKIIAAPSLRHGKVSPISHNGTGIFAGLSDNFKATRYHSLCLSPQSLPDTLKITATSADGVIMGLEHQGAPTHAVQFHPESIASEHGHDILRNFLDIARKFKASHSA